MVSVGPVSGEPSATGWDGSDTSQRRTTCPAPAAASTLPSGLNAATYSGSRTSALTRVAIREGWPGLATLHSRSDPSAPAAASSLWSGLIAAHWTMPAESTMRAADGVPEDSSRLAVASCVCIRPYAETLSWAASGGFWARTWSASSAASPELVACCAVTTTCRCRNT